MYYFDHSATTPPYPEVVQTATEVMQKYYGNPSSLHRKGVEAERLVTRAREVIGASFNVHPDTIIFTSGGTESNNLAIKGIAFQYQNRGKHLITTEIEHASVYDCFKQLETLGFEVTYLPVDASGAIAVNDLKAAVRDDTILVSVMYVNNEVGRIQPIAACAKYLQKFPKLFFHVDAVQAAGWMEMSLYGVDLFTVSAHKLRGPKGVGFLYCRSGIELAPLFAGGGQESGRRAGTENVPLIVAMAKAIRMATEKRQRRRAHLYSLRSHLTSSLKEVNGVIVNESKQAEEMAPHIVHFSVPGMKAEVLLHALEQRDIYVSTRSACSSKALEPSRVLLAMGKDQAVASSGIRISLADDHTTQHIDYLIQQLGAVLRQIGHGGLKGENLF